MLQPAIGKVRLEFTSFTVGLYLSAELITFLFCEETNIRKQLVVQSLRLC
jgi:hypothetical protein